MGAYVAALHCAAFPQQMMMMMSPRPTRSPCPSLNPNLRPNPVLPQFQLQANQHEANLWSSISFNWFISGLNPPAVLRPGQRTGRRGDGSEASLPLQIMMMFLLLLLLLLLPVNKFIILGICEKLSLTPFPLSPTSSFLPLPHTPTVSSGNASLIWNGALGLLLPLLLLLLLGLGLGQAANLLWWKLKSWNWCCQWENGGGGRGELGDSEVTITITINDNIHKNVCLTVRDTHKVTA